MKNVNNVYTYSIINQLGTYISYLAIVAIPGSKSNFLLNLSIFFTARYFGSIIAYKILGLVSHYFSEKKMMLYGNMLSAVLIFAIILAFNHMYVIAVLLVFLGLFDNLVMSSLQDYCYKISKNEELVHINHNLQIITYVTMIVGATIGGSLIQYVDIRSAFIFDGVSYLICSYLVFFLARPDGRVLENNDIENSTIGELNKKIISLLLVLVVLFSIMSGSFNFIEIPYYLDVLKLKYSQIGPFFSVTVFGLVISRYVLKKYKLSKLGSNGLIMLFVLLGVLYYLLSVSSNLFLNAVLLLLFIGTTTITNASIIYIIQTSLNDKDRLKILSLRISLGKLSFLLITPLAGMIANSYGINSAIKSVSIFYLSSLLVIFVFINYRKKVLNAKIAS